VADNNNNATIYTAQKHCIITMATYITVQGSCLQPVLWW